MPNEMQDAKDLLNVCFLLGAGASAEAGIGTMPKLGELFLETFALPELSDYLNSFSEELEREDRDQWSPDLRNIEALLRFLQRVPCESSLQGHLRRRAATILAFEAKKFLLKQVSQHSRNLAYLNPLKEFLFKCKPLDIFSLNYDTVLEDWCTRRRFTLSDGFDCSGFWRPELLQQATPDARLWKLHGSVTWLQNRGQVRRVGPTGSWKEELRAGKLSSLTLQTALIYPAVEKVPEGVLDLLLEGFSNKLETANLLIAIGYSLGDDHIADRVLQALESNPSLILLICNPSASHVKKALLARPGAFAFGNRVEELPLRCGEALQGRLQDCVKRLLSTPASKRPKHPLPDKRRFERYVCLGDFAAVRVGPGFLVLSRRGPFGRASLLRFDLRTCAMETICTDLGDPRDFVLIGNDTLILIDTNFQGKLAGLGATWEVDLRTGDKKLLTRLPGWVCKSAIAPPIMGKVLRRTGMDALRFGLLSWPTGIARAEESRSVLVLESRRVVRLDLDTRRFVPVTQRQFLNAVAIAHWKNQKYLVLEHVFGNDISPSQGLGVLWEVDASENQIRPIVAGLQHVDKLFVIRQENAALIGQTVSQSRWRILRINLELGTIAATAEITGRPLGLLDQDTLLASAGDRLVVLSLTARSFVATPSHS